MDKTEEFILKAEKVHGNKYVYDKVNYEHSKQKVIITCPIHGEFEQTPNKHLIGRGCPKCAIESRSNKTRSTFEEFVIKAKEQHGDKYTYPDSNYINSRTKILIDCSIHGSFYQTPEAHLSGQGCPCCGRERTTNAGRISLDVFKKRCSEVHNNFYDYSKINYNKVSDKVIIICPIHGEFVQSASNHLHGQGCPKCMRKNQTELYNKLKFKFPNLIFDWEFTPTWLGNQRFDIYCSKFNFAIEYNGIQHYQPVDHFGGEERFKKQQEEDLRKARLCEENNCTLFIMKYDYKNKELEDLYNNIQNIIKDET